MTKQEIENSYRQAAQCIDDAEIKDAFRLISSLVDELGRVSLNDELERLNMSYTFMLKYLEQGVMDPQRDDILLNLRQSLYLLNDQCYIGLMEPTSPEVFYARRRELANTVLISIVEEYREELKNLSLMQTVPEQQRDSHAILSQLHQVEELDMD